MIFKKRKKEIVKLAEFSANNVSTGMIGGYILSHLYDRMGFSHIEYKIKNTYDGDLRVVLNAWSPDSKMINYFNDRCPAMIEQEVQKSIQMPHDFIDLGEISIVTKYKGEN